MGGEHPSGIVVRPYTVQDRVGLRTLCHRVGYMGESAAWYWRHVDSFADIWTGYYTDSEPESLFVAVRDGVLLGYLTGCVDSSRAPSPATAFRRAALRHQRTRALRFFEAVGFRRHGAAALVPGMRQPSGGRHHLQLMVAEVPAT